MRYKHLFLGIAISTALSIGAHADENLLGYVKGAETLPAGAWEGYQILT